MLQILGNELRSVIGDSLVENSMTENNVLPYKVVHIEILHFMVGFGLDQLGEVINQDKQVSELPWS